MKHPNFVLLLFLISFIFILLEHHYDNMIDKGYKFNDINQILIKNHFIKIFKLKMPFRKTFEYIYKNEKLN